MSHDQPFTRSLTDVQLVIYNYLYMHPHSSAAQVARGLGFKVAPTHENLRRMQAKGRAKRWNDGGGPKGGSTWTALQEVRRGVSTEQEATAGSGGPERGTGSES